MQSKKNNESEKVMIQLLKWIVQFKSYSPVNQGKVGFEIMFFQIMRFGIELATDESTVGDYIHFDIGIWRLAISTMFSIKWR